MRACVRVQVKILFDESFFNSREESYQVFCLEQPLEGGIEKLHSFIPSFPPSFSHLKPWERTS